MLFYTEAYNFLIVFVVINLLNNIYVIMNVCLITKIALKLLELVAVKIIRKQ